MVITRHSMYGNVRICWAMMGKRDSRRFKYKKSLLKLNMDTSNYSKLNPGPSGGNMGSSAFNSSAYDEIIRLS